MKYCIQYYKDFRYNDIIDEVIFSYASYRDYIVNELAKETWKDDQRLIVDVCLGGTPDIAPILAMCMNVHKNFAVRIDIIQEDLIEELRKTNIPFFYANYAKTMDEVYGMIKRGVSDIYITESLGFNIEKVGTYCREKGVNVRVIPNIAQYRAGFRKEIPDPYKFFVRPEDTALYEQYVDVFELITPKDRSSVVYEIYRNEQWRGDLKQIIVGFDEPFYNSGLVTYFGPERLKCGHKCMQEKCNLCQQMKELADNFVRNQLEVITEKNKEWKNETNSYKEAVRIAEETASNDDVEISEK